MKKTLIELAIKSLKKYECDKPFIFTKSEDIYWSVTRLDIYNKSLALYEYLKELKLKRDEKVAIISENRVEWVYTDLAVMMARLISVPIYTTLSAESIKYIFKDASVKICFVSNTLQLDKILSIKDELPDLEKIVVYNDIDAEKIEGVCCNLNELLKEKRNYEKNDVLNRLEQINKFLDEQDVITIIYTSGTTGVPKGVMLTHKNIYSNVISISKLMRINQHDIFLSYERTAGYYFPIFNGPNIYYAQSIDTIGAQMQEARPTIVITVPRLLDKMYNRLMKNANDMEDGFRKRMLLWGINYAKSGNVNKSSFKWRLADRLVYTKIREKTGGRLRFFVSGGGALHKNVGEFFDAIGIQTIEGYGMTEASPVISVNRPEQNKYGTVGTPLEGVYIKIAQDGEIMVKGDLVMKGYFNMPEETKETIESDGWLHTGDIGEMDTDGFVKITDRKKSLFKSSGGKYIAPAHIENLVFELPYVDQVLVIGNQRMYVTALIVPEMSALKDLMKMLNLNFETESELFTSEAIIRAITKDINEIQKDLAPHEKIRKFTLVEKPFSIESGELTPSLKIKRKFVEDKYAYLIDKMYHKV